MTIRVTLAALLIAILAFVVTDTSHASAYNDAVLADNPLLYWTFDEAGDKDNAKSLVNDMPSNELRAINGAGRAPSTSVGGVSLGRAASFDGIGVSRFFADNLFSPGTGPGEDFIATQQWAVEFWFKAERDGAQYLSETFAAGSNDPGIIYGFNGAASPTPELELFHGARTGAGPVSVGEWHHVVLAFHGNNSGFKDNLREIYVDGVLTADTTSAFSAGHGLNAIGIGNSTLGANPFLGLIDEYAIYELGDITDLAERQAKVAAIAAHGDHLIPEPSSLLLAVLGFIGLGGCGRRRMAYVSFGK